MEGSRKVLPLRNFPVIISITGGVYSRAIAQLEGLGKLEKKNHSMTRSELEPAFSIVDQPTTLLCAPV
jgi:hypothetical protein